LINPNQQTLCNLLFLLNVGFDEMLKFQQKGVFQQNRPVPAIRLVSVDVPVLAKKLTFT
jgi:hypothetical protein